MDERKVSRFQIGDRVTTPHAVRNWAGYQSGKIDAEKIISIEERAANNGKEGGFFYQTEKSGVRLSEDNLLFFEDAKKEAIRFLARRIETIAAWQEDK